MSLFLGGKKGYSRPEAITVCGSFYLETYPGTVLKTVGSVHRESNTGAGVPFQIVDNRYTLHEIDTTTLIQGSVSGVNGSGPQLLSTVPSASSSTKATSVLAWLPATPDTIEQRIRVVS